MADPISLQQVLISAPVDETVGGGDFVLVIGGGSIKLVPMNVIKPESVSIQDFLTSLPRDAEPGGDVVTVVSGGLRRGPVTGLGGGGGIASPDAVALALYSLGMMTVVVGPAVAGTDPPQMAPSTAAKVAHLVSLGIPESYIGWSVVGEEVVGAFPMPSVTLCPVVVPPALSGVQGGGFAAPSVTLPPVVSALSLAGVQQGVFPAQSVALQPVVSAPNIIGAQAGVGVFPELSVTLQPAVSAPSLTGVQAGTFSVPSVSLQPAVSAPSLTGVQVGAFSAASVSVQPVVFAPSLTGVQVGSFAALSVSCRPVVAVPSLAGVVAAIPSAPTQSALTIGDGQLTANWTNVTGETSYTVYYSRSALLDANYSDYISNEPDPPTPVDYPATPNATAGKISGIAADSIAQVITGLTNGATYYVRVSATNASGTSALSAVQSAAPAVIGPAPTAPVTDPFDRADSTDMNANLAQPLWMKPSWAPSSLKIVSLKARGQTSGSYANAQSTSLWNTAVNTFTPDQYAEAVFSAASLGNTRLVLRGSPTTENHYALRCDGMIYKVVAGTNRNVSFSNQVAALGTVTATDVVRFSVQGTDPAVLRIYKNGVLKATVNDATSPITSGQPGAISDILADSAFDNFAAGQL